MADDSGTSESSGLFSNLFLQIISSPVNIALVGDITFLVYKIVKSRQRIPEPLPPEPALPKLRKDFTVAELRKYAGTGPEGRILVAVNGDFNVKTYNGKFESYQRTYVLIPHDKKLTGFLYSPRSVFTVRYELNPQI